MKKMADKIFVHNLCLKKHEKSIETNNIQK